jgi:hypothetical protein
VTRPEHQDDPDLRRLLDSIGLRTGDSPEPVDNARSSPRAEAMLARILEQPRGPGDRPTSRATRQQVRRPWTGLSVAAALVACVVVAVALVVGVPGFGPGPQRATAQTPPLLTFSLAGKADLRTAGESAHTSLMALAERATHLPPSPRLPVQRILAEAWWTSTDPAGRDTAPRTVLVPRHLEVYQFADGSRRSIERRGAALDSRGRVTYAPGSWDEVAPTTDDTFTNDLGAGYPESLPTTIAGLSHQLAPADACGAATGGCLLSAVSDLFAGYVVDPAITARLWRLLASDPSIESLGRTTDRLGRSAEAFVADALDPSQRILILIDPATGGYLGSETILVRPSPDLGFQPPAVTQFTAIVGSSRVAASAVPDDSTTTHQ